MTKVASAIKTLPLLLGHKVDWDEKNDGFDCSDELKHLHVRTFPSLHALKYGAEK